jgi:hypothetical protein
MTPDEILIDMNYLLATWANGMGLFDHLNQGDTDRIIENAALAAFGVMEKSLDIPANS